MLKLLQTTALLFFTASLAAAPHFTLKNSLEKQGGEAQIITPLSQLQFKDDALLFAGRSNELRMTLPDWHGESGTVIFDFLPVNWNGKDTLESIVFVQSVDGSNGNFNLYKYPAVPGLWLLTQAKLSDGKFKNSFPVMDRKSLQSCESGQWQQIALTWKRGDFVKIYLNGQLVGTASGTAFFPADFTTISIGRNTGGTAKHRTLVRNLTFERRPMSDNEIKLQYNRIHIPDMASPDTLIPVAAMAKPKLDGILSPKEYPTRLPGLLDSSDNFELSTRKAGTAWGMDQDFFYIGAEISLPENYRPTVAATTHNDNRLIDKGDLFLLFLTPEQQEQKAVNGIYFSVNSANITYCAEEKVDWGNLLCHRTPLPDSGIRSAVAVRDGVWTIELAIPRKLAPEGKFRASAGFLLNKVRYTLTPQPTWFDYYQGLARFQPSKIGVDIQYNGLESGNISQHLELSGKEIKSGNAVFELASPDLRRSGEGMVVDQLIGEKLELLAGESFNRQTREFRIAPQSPAVLNFQAKIEKPDVYLLSTGLTAEQQLLLRRQVMFRCFSPISITLTPVPSQNQLIVHPMFYGEARKQLPQSQLRLSVSQNGKEILNRNATGSRASMVLPLDRLKAGKYLLKLTLIGKNRNLIAENTVKWIRPPAEEWRKKRAGIEALSPDWCPEPWTPIGRKGDVFSVYGRTYDWTGNSMLAQITSQNEKLLASPAVMKSGSVTAQWSAPEILETARGRIRLAKKGTLPGLSLSADYTLEFDGLVIARFKVKPEQTSVLRNLILEFPLAKLPLMVAQSRTWWQVGAVRKEAWKNFPSLWFGNDHVGINFSAESCKGWWINAEQPRVEVQPTENGPVVKLLAVNQPGRLKHTLDFTIMIQAGPVKPNFKDYLDFRMVGGTRPAPGGNAFYADPRFWSSSYSRPLPLNYERFNDMVDTCHKSGHKVYCYLTPFAISTYDIIPRGTPVTKWNEPLDRFNVLKKKDSKPVAEYFFNAEDWNLSPAQFTGDGVAGHETSEMAYVAPDSSWSDYFADAVRQMLEQSDFDGFYFDLPLPQENFDESKQLSHITRDGVKEGTVQILAARNLYKRLYWLFGKYRMGRHPWIIGHHLRELYPISAFCDLELHGEGVKPKKAFEYSGIWRGKTVKGTPVASAGKIYSRNAPGFRAAHGGTHSIPSIVLPQYGYIPELGRKPQLARELFGWTASSGALLWPVYIHSATITNLWRKIDREWGGFRNTSYSEARSAGYQIAPQELRAGLYRKDNSEEKLLILFNPTAHTLQAETGQEHAVDFETGKPFPAGSDISAGDFKILKIN